MVRSEIAELSVMAGLRVARGRPILFWVAVMSCLAAGCAGTPGGRSGSEVRIQGYDAIALLGGQVELRAKVERVGALCIHPDIEGARVEFALQVQQAPGGPQLSWSAAASETGLQVLGMARSDDDGMAAVMFTPPGAGQFCLVARVVGEAGRPGPQDEFLLSILDPGRAILVSDIDHTIADVSALRFLVADAHEIKPLAQAPAVLGRLSERYQIVYLTARDDTFMARTRDWLSTWGFPRAPALFWDFLGTPSLSHGRFKRERLADLERRGLSLVVGVGDRDADAKAYLANGMRAILIRAPESAVPGGSQPVASWSEVERLLDSPGRGD